jgi:hypothetical protein
MCSCNLERGPGRLGGEGINLFLWIRTGLFGFEQPGLSVPGPEMFFPSLVAAHLTWSIARPAAAML